MGAAAWPALASRLARVNRDERSSRDNSIANSPGIVIGWQGTDHAYAGKAAMSFPAPEHPASTACRTAIQFGRAAMDSSNSKGITAPAAQRNPGDESEPGAPQTA